MHAITTTASAAAQYTDNYFGHIWREYGRADHRWAVRDPNVISLEILTVSIGICCYYIVPFLFFTTHL